MKNKIVGIIVIVVYTLNRFVFKSIAGDNIIGNIIKYHLNDFLGAVLILVYTNLLISLTGKEEYMINTLLKCVILGAVACVFWEGLAPMVLSYSTADVLDCIAIMLGSLLYWVIIRDGSIKKDIRKTEPEQK